MRFHHEPMQLICRMQAPWQVWNCWISNH